MKTIWDMFRLHFYLDFATCSPNPCDFGGECEVDDSNFHECSCSVYEGYEDDCDGENMSAIQQLIW